MSAEPAMIAVVGDATSVAGFRPLGFATFVAEPAETARDLWPELASGRFAVVFVTEEVFTALGELAAETAESPVPAVTVIPAAGRGTGIGEERLERAIERALGTTVPMGEEEA